MQEHVKLSDPTSSSLLFWDRSCPLMSIMHINERHWFMQVLFSVFPFSDFWVTNDWAWFPADRTCRWHRNLTEAGFPEENKQRQSMLSRQTICLLRVLDRIGELWACDFTLVENPHFPLRLGRFIWGMKYLWLREGWLLSGKAYVLLKSILVIGLTILLPLDQLM